MYVRANKHPGTLFTVYIFERGRGHRWQVYADSSYFSPPSFLELAEKLIPYFKLEPFFERGELLFSNEM